MLHAFRGAGWSVRLNSPFEGALVPMRHYRKQRNLAAVMIEANRALYVDEATGERKPYFASVARTIRQHVVAAISLLSLGD